MRDRLESLVRSRICYLYLFFATVFAFFFAKGSGSKLALPILMTLVIYPVYALDLSQGARRLAAFHTFFWAAVASVLMVIFVREDPNQLSNLVFKGIAYRDEMFRWILTGEGAEGNIRLFLPEHLKHFALFCASTLITGGVWGLAFGAILLNYMNFYVGTLSLHAHDPLLVAVLGWPPWSLLRVIGYVLCGVALSEPLLSQLLRFRLNFGKSARWFFFGLLFIVLDILVKANLAGFWRGLLRGLVSF